MFLPSRQVAQALFFWWPAGGPWMLTLLALYGGLFLTALVAATLLPAQSELLLGTLLV